MDLSKAQGGEKPADVTDKNFHCVIHVLRWSDPDATEKQTVVAQNWYVYNNGNAKGLRSDRIWSQKILRRLTAFMVLRGEKTSYVDRRYCCNS